MKLTYLNIMYFLYYKKIHFLYNDVQINKQKKSAFVSHLLNPCMYKLKIPSTVYNSNIIAKTYINTYVNTYVNTHVNTHVNTNIKNKLL